MLTIIDVLTIITNSLIMPSKSRSWRSIRRQKIRCTCKDMHISMGMDCKICLRLGMSLSLIWSENELQFSTSLNGSTNASARTTGIQSL